MRRVRGAAGAKGVARGASTASARGARGGRAHQMTCMMQRTVSEMEHAQYIERATMPEQRVLALRDVPKDGAPYFSMILVRHGETEAGV